ncbi:adenylyl-sulfate kinase [Actinosynnema sp. NPDC047251]|uniref:Adenylyl-sulfate kinase n=1 Tax=Saccharothrix espanaensis (strain ATCC 51144 / DSM 44229 / JCM 9112 / NBRC 15066 / NRRL 15764) TaxID=1179773 RepID=K0K8C1_SACES|nr:adenylyl-sulfate kinase [Saccharothrix espanaensis]CCH32923.1 Adenylylsulfate kinase [Saccharothrix espanaensis DSM 44229]
MAGDGRLAADDPPHQLTDKDLLRFITCGSVDDGKSTLIGRLLHEARLVLDDQFAVLVAESARRGMPASTPDFSLLVDGLAAEREQGITIDVAHRYFATATRRFVVGDSPGHEQYTRNMVTAASTADAAVVLVDAAGGVRPQTRRHLYLVSLLGIRHVLVVVNKLDLLGYSVEAFEHVEREMAALARAAGLPPVHCLPASALHGDNIVRPSSRTPWYRGPSLLRWLESVPVGDDRARGGPARLPVQVVLRREGGFRGYAGPVVGGELRPGDEVVVLPGGARGTVDRIVTYDGDRESAVAGQSVAVTLVEDVDVGRGDLLCAADRPATVADRIEADLVWLDRRELHVGRGYLLKLGTGLVGAVVSGVVGRLEVGTLAEVPATSLGLNEIARCELVFDRPLAFDLYQDNRDTGAFLLIDRVDGATLGAGMVRGVLGRSRHLYWQQVTVDREQRAAGKGHRPSVVWLTGLSGAGKTTIADLLERRLHSLGVHTYLLDGDNVRHGLNRDLGFSAADRVENIRRVAEVARLMADAGLVVIVALISPFRAERATAKGLVPEGDFHEVFVDAPLAVAEARDPKGLYAKARRGELPGFTGVDSPYEPPEHPDLRVDTSTCTPEAAVRAVLGLLHRRGVLRATEK